MVSILNSHNAIALFIAETTIAICNSNVDYCISFFQQRTF